MTRNADSFFPHATAERPYREMESEELEGSGNSAAGMALRYVGLLAVTLASAIAISGFAPADVVAAVGL